ncbi:hypothetical protein CHLRE_08g386100v5 [Chlamydomonas reinhardtii]|uniref:Uncharacterized protein n=1 Tax=Chlamydomonas reinhardtii TaxID=3055 RepID=A0A2K3DID8_CHLRE|nr:uncharacterized protein CHLRE_08g386100v5 [Chlamydomonas reinhardtii]PNW80303.1 hypothetical protein CHLRE_08g386100v5 [Chlamydomonas reinhardtii]
MILIQGGYHERQSVLSAGIPRLPAPPPTCASARYVALPTAPQPSLSSPSRAFPASLHSLPPVLLPRTAVQPPPPPFPSPPSRAVSLQPPHSLTFHSTQAPPSPARLPNQPGFDHRAPWPARIHCRLLPHIPVQPTSAFARSSRTTVRAPFPAAGVKPAGNGVPARAMRPASRTTVRAPFPAAGVKPAGNGVPAHAVRPAYASRTTVRAPFPAAGVKPAGNGVPAHAVRPAYASRTTVRAPFPAAGVKPAGNGVPAHAVRPAYASRTTVRAPFPAAGVKPAGNGVPARAMRPAYASRTTVRAPFPAAGVKPAGNGVPAHAVRPAYASRTTVRAPFPAAGVKPAGNGVPAHAVRPAYVTACRHMRCAPPTPQEPPCARPFPRLVSSPQVTACRHMRCAPPTPQEPPCARPFPRLVSSPQVTACRHVATCVAPPVIGAQAFMEPATRSAQALTVMTVRLTARAARWRGAARTLGQCPSAAALCASGHSVNKVASCWKAAASLAVPSNGSAPIADRRRSCRGARNLDMLRQWSCPGLPIHDAVRPGGASTMGSTSGRTTGLQIAAMDTTAFLTSSAVKYGPVCKLWFSTQAWFSTQPWVINDPKLVRRHSFRWRARPSLRLLLPSHDGREPGHRPGGGWCWRRVRHGAAPGVCWRAPSSTPPGNEWWGSTTQQHATRCTFGAGWSRPAFHHHKC